MGVKTRAFSRIEYRFERELKNPKLLLPDVYGRKQDYGPYRIFITEYVRKQVEAESCFQMTESEKHSLMLIPRTVSYFFGCQSVIVDNESPHT